MAFGASEVGFHEIELGEQLGSGSFGVVYSGKCRGIVVAVKRPGKQEFTERVLADLRKEVDIMR